MLKIPTIADALVAPRLRTITEIWNMDRRDFLKQFSRGTAPVGLVDIGWNHSPEETEEPLSRNARSRRLFVQG